MKLLLDQGLPAGAALMFPSLGYACAPVSEIGMHNATDEVIANMAATERFLIITSDADFHALVAVRKLRFPSIIRLRGEGRRAEESDDDSPVADRTWIGVVASSSVSYEF